MITRDPDELPWHQWLTLLPKELYRQGHDPSRRAEQVGHPRYLTGRWVRSVGMWGVATSAEIIRAVGLDPGRPGGRASFDVFKSRRRLWDGAQLARRRGIGPHDQFALATAIHAHVWSFRRGRALPRRTATATSQEMLHASAELHVLPVEVLLYFSAVEGVMSEELMNLEAWNRRSLDRRRAAWNAAWGEPDPIRFPPEHIVSHAAEPEVTQKADASMMDRTEVLDGTE